MRAWHFNPWLSAFLISVWIVACLAHPGPVAAAGAPGPGGPEMTPPSSIACTPTAMANTPNVLAVAESEADAWTEAAMTQPVDAFHDPLFWAVMGLVVLGHFVLASEFRQGQ